MPTQEERDAVTLAKAAEILDKKAAKESNASQSVILKAVDNSKKSVVFQALTNVRITDGVEVSAEPGTIGRVGPRFPKRMSITAQTGGFSSTGGTVGEARALIGKAVYVNSRVASATIPIWVVDSVETDDSNEYTNQVGITVSLTELIGADLIANGFPLFIFEEITTPDTAATTNVPITGVGPASCVAAYRPLTIPTILKRIESRTEPAPGYGPGDGVTVRLPDVTVPFNAPATFFVIPFFPPDTNVVIAGRKKRIEKTSALKQDPLRKRVADRMDRRERVQLDALTVKIKSALAKLRIPEKRFAEVFMDAVVSFPGTDGYPGVESDITQIAALYFAAFPFTEGQEKRSAECVNVNVMDGVSFIIKYDFLAATADAGNEAVTSFDFATATGAALGNLFTVSQDDAFNFINGGTLRTGKLTSESGASELVAKIYVVKNDELDAGATGPTAESIDGYRIIVIVGHS